MINAVLIDVTKCQGCMSCVNACVESKGGDRTRTAKGSASLSATQRSTVVVLDGGAQAKLGCMHCLEPSCASACLVGAIEKRPDGPVTYDPDKCMGCRYCMLACPFHIPRYEWESTEPLMKKCDMCNDRIEKGETPLCVSACPHDALEFGERSALIDKAKKRIADHPGRYLDHVWGEKEWGGASMIYISPVSLEALGWPTPDIDTPISALTDPLIHATPVIGLSVLLGSWGLGAIIARRNKLMRRESGEESATKPDKQENGDAE